MPEDTGKNIRIPVAGEEGEHTDHKIRTIIISDKEGIKALYCVDCKKVITYLFAKNKGWDMKKAKEWVAAQKESKKKLSEVTVDQSENFLKIVATKADGTTEEYLPNSDPFILDKSIEEFTTGISAIGGTDDDDVTEIIKLDKQKQIVYGVFLVPDKADHDGDVISPDDIEKVAHEFNVTYRTIDEMHKNVISAEVVESMIAWQDGLDFYGKTLKKGTWFGAIKINDKDVWEKVLSGEYKAFSVRIAGVREPIEEGSNA
jgi:hypothetical protein